MFLAAGVLLARPAHAATFTVTNTNDSGTGSLRQAINDANARIGADTIIFDIPGAGPHTISPTSALPQITDPVTIKGYSQPGAKPNTLAVGNNAVLKIELSGTNLASSESGLEISAANSTVKGLVVNRFPNVGIAVCCENTTGVKIEGNYIGTDTTGVQAQGNSSGGVDIGFGTPNTTIGGATAGARNVISGNGANGVYVSGSGNRVQGNYIGTDKNGAADLGNSNTGVSVSEPNNTVGGTIAGARNVISGNGGTGVAVSGSIFASVAGNKVMGNYVGTDATGAQDLGNSIDGVFISLTSDTIIGGTSAGARNVISGNNNHGVSIDRTDAAGNNKVQGNRIGTNAAGTEDLGNTFDGVRISDAPNNTVGGTTAEARNVISGNDASGIFVSGPEATGNQVMGNYVGTDVTGTLDRGNFRVGVFVDAPGNTVGGTTAGARNVISGNGDEGVLLRALDDPGASGNQVQGNYVGTDRTGTRDLGNSSDGVSINDTPDNIVGGTTAGARNVISGNDRRGILVTGSASTGNRILSNSIFSNGFLGIDLNQDGETANDQDDPDTGANNLQNYPVLTSVKVSRKKGTTVTGTLNSTPGATFTLQFFAGPSDDGEGKRYLGSKSVTTDTSGDVSFTFKTRKKASGEVTATATNDASGDTSEFSAALAVQ